MSKSGSSITYGYNADGKRISKTVNGTTYNFSYLGDQLTEMTWGSNKLHFTYDSIGPASVTYNGNRYFYLKNAQGDVTGLVNASGTQVVSYTYDPWGAPMSTDGTMASTLGAANPLRYRGYVYDAETGLYYLSSRYYNPVWGRFINADGYASTGQGFTGYNMFAYCNGNPLRYRGYVYDTETGFYYVSSRYYNPEVGRWINADNQIAGVGGEILGYNMFAYCMNNPVNMSDPTGNWPKWATKLAAAVAVVSIVAVVAVVTVATAGAGTAIAAVAVGAAKGAAIGFAVGAATGAAGGAISHRISTGGWNGAGKASLNGMANGALSGAVSGAITGGITGSLSYNSGATSAGKGFDTYRQLKNEIGSPGAGNEWHHIVEQSQIAKSDFSPQMIQNTNNIISISKTTHRAISGYYSSVQPFTNGMIVRNWLAGQSFSAQYEFGINVIKLFM